MTEAQKQDEQDRGTSRRLTIAVATYLRPADIERCVRTIAAEVAALTRTRPDIDAEILVVDNDPAASAREVVEALGAAEVRYVVEQVPGISAARNRALAESASSDLLIFLDDDEEPTSGWLGRMLETQKRWAADAVAGRVVSDLEGVTDEWLHAGGFFRRRTLPTGTPINVAATNNLLLDLNVVRTFGLTFDARYGLTGGGDTHFTRSLVSRGGTMVWCDEAVVVDHVPPERLTRSWVLARARRTGNTEVVVSIDLADSMCTRLARRARGGARGAARLCLGSAQRIAGGLVGSLTMQARGAKAVARGRGMLAGALGRRVGEYGRLASQDAGGAPS